MSSKAVKVWNRKHRRWLSYMIRLDASLINSGLESITGDVSPYKKTFTFCPANCSPDELEKYRESFKTDNITGVSARADWRSPESYVMRFDDPQQVNHAIDSLIKSGLASIETRDGIECLMIRARPDKCW